MRCSVISCFAITTLFSGCAYEGVIVEKRFRPLPFADSLGVDAIYNFQLRDSAGQIHSQMVTADVFANYRVGDYFNDLQPAPSHEGKEMEGFRPIPLEMNEGPYQPVRVMQIERPPVKEAAKVVALVDQPVRKPSKAAKTHHRTKRSSKVARNHHARKRMEAAKETHTRHHRRIASAD